MDQPAKYEVPFPKLLDAHARNVLGTLMISDVERPVVWMEPLCLIVKECSRAAARDGSTLTAVALDRLTELVRSAVRRVREGLHAKHTLKLTDGEFSIEDFKRTVIRTEAPGSTRGYVHDVWLGHLRWVQKS